MRILQFCPKPPLPSLDGGCLASYELSKIIIASSFDLKLLCLASEKHPFRPEFFDQTYTRTCNPDAVTISTKKPFYYYLFKLFSTKSAQIGRFKNPQVEEFLIALLKKENFDLIVFDGLMTCVYLQLCRKLSKAKIIYRSHNIEHALISMRSKEEVNPIRKVFFKSESHKIKAFETNIWNSCDQVWSISMADSLEIRNTIGNVKVLDMPFTLQGTKNSMKAKENTLFHLGSMDWRPNFIGLRSFIKDVWPLILVGNKDLELHLAGKNIGKVERHLKGKNIYIHDNVPDSDNFFKTYDVLIVPVNAASGIRIKTVQALSMGKVVVSTKSGASGINAINYLNMLISKSPLEMADQIISLFRNKELKVKIEREAMLLYEREFSEEIGKNKLKTALSEL